MSRPLLLLAGSFGAGCLVGGEGSRLVALLLAGLAGLLLTVAWGAGNRRAAASAVVFAAFGLGAAAATAERLTYDGAPLRDLAASRRPADGAVELRGTLRGDAQVLPDQARFTLDVTGMAGAGRELEMAGSFASR